MGIENSIPIFFRLSTKQEIMEFIFSQIKTDDRSYNITKAVFLIAKSKAST